MGKSIYKSLSDLKKHMPRGYQRKISDRLMGITIDMVKNAFCNRLKDEEKLLKILFEAQRLTKVKTMKKAKAIKATREAIKTAKKVA